MSGRGRGRGLTLPAWMTTGEVTMTDPVDLGVNESMKEEIKSETLESEFTNENNSISAYSSENSTSNVVSQPSTRVSSSSMSSTVPNSIPNSNPNSNSNINSIINPIPTMVSSSFPNTITGPMPTIVPNFQPQTIPMNTFIPNIYSTSGYPSFIPNIYSSLPARGIPGPILPTPPPPPPLPLAPPIATGDPNNEKTNWSVHFAEDGRRFWYNRVTEQSTYDKPFCLKTPEERSIPACKWKEYSANGRKYYSDGKDSVWEEPDEYREWREKIEAIEAKANQKPVLQVKEDPKKKIVKEVATVVYSNPIEAGEAFTTMLTEKKITSTMKAKEIKDLCQDDPRWNALKTTGEKNQAIAEYQTKKVKQEKELKQAKAKKFRDSFLIMLAENTKIDARTRWGEAIAILKDDNRYKNIEDPREREDLYTEFISELVKKEREDKLRIKDSAFKQLHVLLEDLKAKGEINRTTIWADFRETMLEYIRSHDIKGLDEFDIKRSIQDIVSKLDNQYKEEERKRREERVNVIKEKQNSFYNFLEKLGRAGIIREDDRARDILDLKCVIQSKEYEDLVASYHALNENPSVSIRDMIDRVLSYVRNVYKNDRRVIHDVLHEVRYDIHRDTTFSQFKAVLLKFSSLQEIVNTETGVICYVPDVKLAEDGEELDESSSISRNPTVPRSKESISLSSQVRELLIERISMAQVIFDDILRQVILDHEEELKKQRRREERFIELLQEHYYRSDQIHISWEEAKRTLERRSAYESLNKSDRKRLFLDYMNTLKTRMEEKTKNFSVQRGFPSLSTAIEEGEEKSSDQEMDEKRDMTSHSHSQTQSQTQSHSNSNLELKRNRSHSNISGSDDSDDDDEEEEDNNNDSDSDSISVIATTTTTDGAGNGSGEKEKSKKSKKEKHKKDKDKHKHKKHKRDKTERNHDEEDRKKRHRSRS